MKRYSKLLKMFNKIQITIFMAFNSSPIKACHCWYVFECSLYNIQDNTLTKHFLIAKRYNKICMSTAYASAVVNCDKQDQISN